MSLQKALGQKPILWHTEDKNKENREKLYREEGTPYFTGNLFIPEDETVITL